MASYRFVMGAPAVLGIVVLAMGSCENGGPTEPVVSVRNGGSGAATSPGAGGAQNDGGMLLFDADVTDGSVATPPFAKAALIRAAGDCALAGYEHFATVMAIASDKATLYAGTPTEASLAEARTAWRVAMGAWQRTELLQFGPAARSTSPGGQGLRDQIYSFPPAARCQVDVQLVNQAYKGPDFSQTFINGRGLGALEYLLWNTSAANACLSFNEINTKGTWAAIPAVELARRRADYAAVVAKDVLARAQTLLAAWNAGGFRDQLLNAGKGSTLFASEQAALNAISDAIFYLDELKDDKIGRALECISATGTCPEELESTFARESTANLVNNLVGARNALLGCGPGGAGLGFDDWLAFIGQGDKAAALTQDLNDALNIASTFDPLETALVSSPEKVRGLRDAIRKVTTFLKTEFASLLNLDRPMTVEGDND